jgi:3-hydroxymyristoyl/3-hydroxydecanoyl-(acyl carrier protein) dehydratase
MSSARLHAMLRRLPHARPMLLIEEIVDVTPGQAARTRRTTTPDDWFFAGHFPDEPVVPAIVYIELIAQTGGLAIASVDGPDVPTAMRIAAVSQFKFPAGAGPGAILDASARVVGRFDALVKIEGEVTADGAIVATGGVTLAIVAPPAA